MSTQTISGRVPELTLGWRLKMALGDMRRDDIAESLGVNPATVTRWMGDRGAKPRRAYILQPSDPKVRGRVGFVATDAA